MGLGIWVALGSFGVLVCGLLHKRGFIFWWFLGKLVDVCVLNSFCMLFMFSLSLWLGWFLLFIFCCWFLGSDVSLPLFLFMFALVVLHLCWVVCFLFY